MKTLKAAAFGRTNAEQRKRNKTFSFLISGLLKKGHSQPSMEKRNLENPVVLSCLLFLFFPGHKNEEKPGEEK